VKHRGIALLMGLVLLAAISLLALMATNSMLLQSRMSANFGERGKALARATRAIAAATSWLYSRPDFERERDCTSGCQLPVAIHAPGQLLQNPELRAQLGRNAMDYAAKNHAKDVVVGQYVELFNDLLGK